MSAVLPIIDDCCADNSNDTEAAVRREKKRLKNQSRRKTRTENRNKSLFNVERIVDEQIIEGVLKYCVKWENFHSSENTWEPRESLKHLIKFKEYTEEKAKHSKRR